MAKQKICQINNLKIYQVVELAPLKLVGLDLTSFHVYTPQGKLLEVFQKLKDAKGFCQKTEDFVKRKRKTVFTFSEICDAATDSGWWEHPCRRKDEARFQAEEAMLARGVVSQAEFDGHNVTEEDVENWCMSVGALFDDRGNMIRP
jgi:hypothetical protein